MEDKRTKLSFSILPSKPTPPKPPATPPAAFSAAAAGPLPGAAPRFVTTFDPAQPLAPPAAPPVVIAPLPNSRALAGAASRVVGASDNNPSPSPNAGHGLALRGTEEPKRRRLASPDDAAAATRRFKQDMAVLPDDTQGADEHGEVPVEGFGAALLAGYGWKEGNPVGRDKSKGDPKVVEHGRRVGTQGLGAGPSDKSDSAVRPAVRRSVRVLRD